jgi:DNA-directed RNA polymerase subunit L
MLAGNAIIMIIANKLQNLLTLRVSDEGHSITGWSVTLRVSDEGHSITGWSVTLRVTDEGHSITYVLSFLLKKNLQTAKNNFFADREK